MDITPEIVRELLHYNPETGIFTWLERDRGWFGTDRAHKIWNTSHSGKRAGALQSGVRGYKYRVLGLLGKKVLEHRIAWLYMVDDPLPEQIDHINRDATDNRWCNLRASSNYENSRNQPMKRSNTSGVTGVVWHKDRCKWWARCKVSGKYRSLGLFTDLDEAAEAVRSFRAKHGFDPDHGVEPAHYHA